MPKIMEQRLETLQTVGVGVVFVALSFQFNGTGAPTLVRGLKCAVARADTGIFTVTMPGGAPQVVGIVPGMCETGAKGGGTNTGIALESCSVSNTAGTFGLRVMNMGTTSLIDVSLASTVRATVFVALAGSDVRLKGA